MGTAKRPAARPGSASRVSPTAPESKSASVNVWRMLESLPGFNERLERGKAQLAAGESVPFREVRGHR